LLAEAEVALSTLEVVAVPVVTGLLQELLVVGQVQNLL
jgi:hypothetical protein